MINLYTVDTPREIIGMNINGPLTTPTPMEYHNVLKMVKAGYTVYQHNPFNLNEKVKVTIRNINNIVYTITADNVILYYSPIKKALTIFH